MLDLNIVRQRVSEIRERRDEGIVFDPDVVWLLAQLEKALEEVDRLGRELGFLKFRNNL